MNLQILEKKERDNPNDRRRLEISVNEVRRLERILKELLDFARPLSIEVGPASLNAVVLSSMELLDMKFREKQITCTADLDPGIDSIRADAGKIEQVLINLLLNAVDSVGVMGAIHVSTRLNAGVQGPGVSIRVADDGCGVLPDQIGTIFEPYYTTKSTGIGLGLSNVRRIVEAHEGTVRVQRLAPRGACFTIDLPRGGPHGQNPRR
jgi:signal transduction histidine kinase